MIIRHFKPAQQKKAIWFLLVSAQLAILLMGALRTIPYSWLPQGIDMDFIFGFLTGYSIVANMAFLACTGKLLGRSINE